MRYLRSPDGSPELPVMRYLFGAGAGPNGHSVWLWLLRRSPDVGCVVFGWPPAGCGATP